MGRRCLLNLLMHMLGQAGPPSYYQPFSSTRHSRSPDYRSSYTVVSPAITSTTQPLPQPPHQSQPHGQYQTLQTHISGVASLPSLPPGRFPAMNDKGQCICRQCGLPGQYKEEKWLTGLPLNKGRGHPIGCADTAVVSHPPLPQQLGGGKGGVDLFPPRISSFLRLLPMD